MTFETRRTKILYDLPSNENFCFGEKFTLNQNFNDKETFDFKNMSPGEMMRKKEDLLDLAQPLQGEELKKLKHIKEVLGRTLRSHDLIQNVVGLLVNEYYNKEEDFAKDRTLVTELQKNLKELEYDLGNFGSNRDGIDGGFGTKTKTSIGNFEQDYSEDIKALIEQKQEIKEALKGRIR